MKTLMTALVMIVGIGFVKAQSPATPGVTDRQELQTKRTAQGVKSGELTRRETKAIVQQQKNIQKAKRVAKADGVVTKRERAILHKKQNEASRNIARKKNNNRSRG